MYLFMTLWLWLSSSIFVAAPPAEHISERVALSAFNKPALYEPIEYCGMLAGIAATHIHGTMPFPARSFELIQHMLFFFGHVSLLAGVG